MLPSLDSPEGAHLMEGAIDLVDAIVSVDKIPDLPAHPLVRFLRAEFPDFMRALMAFDCKIASPLLPEFLVHLSTLFTWTFAHDMHFAAGHLLFLFDRGQKLYRANADGQCPSALWLHVVSAYVDLGEFEFLSARFSEPAKQIWHFELFQYVLGQLFDVLESSRVETGSALQMQCLTDYFAHTAVEQSFDFKTTLYPVCRQFLRLVNSPSLRDFAEFIRFHMVALFGLFEVFLTQGVHLDAVAGLLNELLEADVPAILQHCNDYFRQCDFLSRLLAQIPYHYSLNLLIANFSAFISVPVAIKIWHRSHASIFKDYFLQCEHAQIQSVLPLFDLTDSSLPGLLIFLAGNWTENRPALALDLTKFIVSRVPLDFQLRSFLILLGDMGQSAEAEIYEIVIENLTAFVNALPLLTFFVKRDPSRVTQDLFDRVFDATIEGGSEFIPLLDLVFRSGQIAFTGEMAEALMAVCAGDALWRFFQSVVEQRGTSAFNSACTDALASTAATPAFQGFVRAFVRVRNAETGKIANGAVVVFPLDHFALLEAAFPGDAHAHLPARVGKPAVEPFVRAFFAAFQAGRARLESLFAFAADFERDIQVREFGIRRHKVALQANEIQIAFEIEGSDDTDFVFFPHTGRIADLKRAICRFKGLRTRGVALYFGKERLLDTSRVSRHRHVTVRGSIERRHSLPLPTLVLHRIQVQDLLLGILTAKDDAAHTAYRFLRFLPTDPDLLYALSEPDVFFNAIVDDRGGFFHRYAVQAVIACASDPQIHAAFSRLPISYSLRETILSDRILKEDLLFLAKLCGDSITDDITVHLGVISAPSPESAMRPSFPYCESSRPRKRLR
jgi:hypothetical protein